MANKTSSSPTTFVSMGSINSVVYGIDKNELILRFVSNVSCQGQTFHSAEVHFRCDDSTPKNDSRYNRPTLLEDLPCHPIIQWNTPVVCGNVGDPGLTAQATNDQSSSITGGGTINNN